MQRLVMYSGGLCSWAAAMRSVQDHGRDGTTLLFADTLIEDEDLYRFAVESAAVVLGCDRDCIADLIALAREIPPVEADEWDQRAAILTRLREDAQAVIPGLAWVADGRTPFEVFIDERFIGNSRVDPCSKILKRKLMDRWRDENCDPATARLVFGLTWDEGGRIEGERGKPGHRTRTIASGWRPEYPLYDERPWLTQKDIEDQLRSYGIAVPRLYDLGFPHNNCGGYCCKMGLAQARHLLATMPSRYHWYAAREREAIEAIGGSAGPSLCLRGGGKKTPITMDAFAALQAKRPGFFDDQGWGCKGGCAID